ncbi:MAG: DUF2961 domain-containing protein [Candidatus Kerfeldbacteria bacterium]
MHARSITIVASIAVFVLVSGYVYVKYTDLQRQVSFIGERSLFQVSGVSSDTIDHVILNRDSVMDATLAGKVYLTTQLANGSIASAVVTAATVTNGALSPNATIQYPDGTTAKVRITSNDIIYGWRLAKNSVTTVKLIDAAVTTVKLKNGAVTEVKILNGVIKSNKIANGQIKAVHLQSDSIITAKIANHAVTEAKIETAAVTGSKIADSAITGEKILDGSITGTKLADGAVSGGTISNQSVTTDKIADGAVTGEKIADGAVTTNKIANLSLTAAKIATGTITATQIASDGSVVKSIVGNSIVQVTNNNNGSYSIALTTSCDDQQILKYMSGSWQCADDQGYFTPQDIYRFPYVGPQKTDWWDNYPSTVHPTTPNYLLYLGEGKSGVVRNIWSVGSTIGFSDWTDVDDYELRIYVGAGNIADTANPPTQYLTAQIPLGMLMGGVYDTTKTPGQVYQTAVMDYSGGSNIALTLSLPIPFENGILIQYWNRTGTPQPVTGLSNYHWVSYEEGTSSFPYQSWRLKAATLRNTMNYNDPESTFLNVSSKPGMLVGIFASFKPTGDQTNQPDPYEGNWRFYTDGSGDPVWQTSGGEDILGLNPFYFSAGEIATQNWGTTYWDGVSKSESYRLFVQDPIIWQNGIRGALQNGLYNAGSSDPMFEANILTLYYAEK